MSYDFELYSAQKRNIGTPPALSIGNVRVDGPDKLEDEDIAASYRPVIGRKRWLYRIHLEGEITKADQLEVINWLRTIVVESKGVLIDLQSENYETTTKSGAIANSDEVNSETGAMSFFFEDGEWFYETGFEKMLETIAEIFPTALPQRYGNYEPLQGKLEKGRYNEIVSAFQLESSFFFMRSQTPFGHIYMSIPCKKYFENMDAQHSMRRHFLLGNVCFELKPKLFENPTHVLDLLRLFKALCVQLNVVYAEILQTDEPSEVWFWRGLPDRKAVHTICIGQAYSEVWPEMATAGDLVGKHHWVVTHDRFGNTPPRPPSGLLAPQESGVDLRSDSPPIYASVFPFDFTFDGAKFVW
jgi:hypothetical protein